MMAFFLYLGETSTMLLIPTAAGDNVMQLLDCES
jgi:hypothetical protein